MTEAVASAEELLNRRLELVRVLDGGQHASTARVTDGNEDYIIRAFPRGHDAALREAEVLPRLSALGGFVPQLVTASTSPDNPLVVTTVVPGGLPSPELPVEVIARQMAAALVRIHALDGVGLPPAPEAPPSGTAPIALRAQREWADLDRTDLVLTHFDFWAGNAVWTGERLTGVVDWAGARRGPRGIDLAWCRQDLALLGSTSAPDVFLAEYERLLGRSVSDINAWDVQAGAIADRRVETWLPNYHGIGRTDITASDLRQRLDSLNARL
nr:aminoglycoside phosphotransferase family protein [Brevibacterium sp. XM4083]